MASDTYLQFGSDKISPLKIVYLKNVFKYKSNEEI